MKILTATTLLIASSISFAQTCYKVSSPVPSYVTLPQVVCVESFGTKVLRDGLSLKAQVVSNLGTSSSVVDFPVSETMKFNKTVKETSGEACSEYSRTYVSFEFAVDANGNTVPDSLSVKGYEESAYDPCHSNLRTEEYSYTKI